MPVIPQTVVLESMTLKLPSLVTRFSPKIQFEVIGFSPLIFMNEEPCWEILV